MLQRENSVAVRLGVLCVAAPVVAMALAGCGQKGPLVLPQPLPAASAASSPPAAAPR